MALHTGPLEPGIYEARPFDPPLGGHDCQEPPQAGCAETTVDDANTFTVPDGWAGRERTIGLAEEGWPPPFGAGMAFHRGP